MEMNKHFKIQLPAIRSGGIQLKWFLDGNLQPQVYVYQKNKELENQVLSIQNKKVKKEL